MMDSLTEEFKKDQVSDKIRVLLSKAEHLVGSHHYHNFANFNSIVKRANQGDGQIFLWDLARKNTPSIMILPDREGRILKEYTDLPCDKWSTRPVADALRRLRSRSEILEVAGSHSHVIFFMEEGVFEEALAAMEHEQSETEHELEHREQFKRDHYLKSQEMERILDGLRNDPILLESLLATEKPEDDPRP